MRDPLGAQCADGADAADGSVMFGGNSTARVQEPELNQLGVTDILGNKGGKISSILRKRGYFNAVVNKMISRAKKRLVKNSIFLF